MPTEEEDAELAELRRKREERRRLQQEEEKREEEERTRKEEERKQRKLERERKAKEREEAHSKELEESRKRNDKEEERKKRREEREKQKLEEEKLEKEAEEKRAKEREEKKKKELEAAEEEERNKKKKEAEDALRKSQEDLPPRDKREEVRPDSRRRTKNDKLMDIIKSGKPDSMDKIVVDEDMKEEATKLLTEENELVVEFFNKSETIITILKYISTIETEPHKYNDDQLEDIMGRIEFAKEAITGGIPSLWRTLLHPDHRAYLAELFGLLKNDAPLLPPINVSCFWKSIEFLLNRRSYEVTNFMMSNKEIIPSFFKHLRDTNLMDTFFKLVEREATSSVLFKEYDPKKAAELPADDTKFWTDVIPENILATIAHGSAGTDTEWSDVEIESIASFSVLVLEKFPDSKLAYQLRDTSFSSALIGHVFNSFTDAPNGVSAANGATHAKAKYKYQSTVVALLSYLIQLLKFCPNNSAYETDTIPPLVACLIYGSGGKGSRSSVIPVNIIRNWVANKIPEFENPIEHLGKKHSSKIGVMRVKCVQLLRALFLANFQCVDTTLRNNGCLQVCVDLFFHNVDNNIVHSIIEEIIKMFLLRETNAPLPELDASSNPVTPFTQFLLDDCNLVERLVATLRTIALNKNEFTHFNTSKLDLDEPAPGAQGAAPAKSAQNGKPQKLPEREKREKPFLPPAFVGHVLDICKAITVASEKSVKVRHLVASCSGYHWGQTVMFHLGMRDSADMEWKKPFKKPVPSDNSPLPAAKAD